MSIANPIGLLLLLAIPLTWVIGYPRYAFRRRRDIAALTLRTAMLLCLILAVSGLEIVRTVDTQAVVFLVDASDSMGTNLADAQVDYIEEAVNAKATDDEWGVVVFGADVSIDKPLNSITDVSPLRSEVLGSNTDLAEAIQTAISLFPADARRRIVVLSDGQQTVGDAESKARLADASGVEVSYVLFAREPQPDVRVTELETPAQVNRGQEYDITVSVESEVATDATLLLYASNELLREQDVQLESGSNRFTFTQRSGDAGFQNFSAQVLVPGTVDSFSQNNQLGAFSEVVGANNVLVIARDDAETSNLIPALESAGVRVDTIRPAQLPASTGALAQYDSLIIANVPATDFSEAQMQRVQQYVQDLGGGLTVIGGPDAYAPGGYYQTPLEAVLPVETRISDQERLPQLTIAYLIDSSGSMGSADSGVGISNLELALRAVNRSIDFLQPSDRVAVGTFDSSGQWVARFQSADDREALQQRLSTLRAGGGTDILSGLQLVERDIGDEPSDLKQLILLTDGGASRTGLVDKVAELNEEFDARTTVIAITQSPPVFLREMADVGEGNFYQVADVSQIPNIFAQETVLASRSYIEEGDFTLSLSANSPIVQGITSLPPLRGYVATTPKQTAQIILRAPEPHNDPILAQWQYGLGRVVAFTSDATSRWGSEWVAWEQFPRFWAQVIDWTITDTADQNIETRVIMEDDQARLIIDAREDDGTFLNNLALQASVVSPDDSQTTVPLRQTAPGRYEGTFTPQDEGAYYLAVNGSGTRADGSSRTLNEITGWVMSYSPEYVSLQPNEALLAELATITGGQSLAETPDATFATSQEPRTASAPVAPWLILIAILLLPLDIAVRRLVISRRDLQRLRAYLFGTRSSDETEARMSSLLGARDRARQRTAQGERDERTVRNLRDALRQRRDDVTPSDDTPPDAPPSTPSPPAPRRPRSTPPSTGSGSTVSELLKRRRDEDETTDSNDDTN